MREFNLVVCMVGVWAMAITSSADVRAAPGDDRNPIIVLEANVGQRTESAARIIPSFREELEVQGFAARPATIARILGRRAPRPGILDTGGSPAGLTTAELVQPVDVGYRAWTQAKFEDAEKFLRPAIERLERNPALVVTDTSNLNVMYKALVAMALSQAKLGEAAQSVETMLELIRVFPTQPISRTEYGPAAEQLYRSVYLQAQAMGRGRLLITVGNDRAVIFVNGQIRGVGKAELGNLVPGIYRVFVQVPATVGRQYEVQVAANDDSALDIKWDVDAALWVADPWVGFLFATAAERAKEGAFAGELARRWGGSTGSIGVVGAVPFQGKPAMIATLYGANGDVVRSGVVMLHGNDEVRLRSLAKFLSDGTEADGVSVVSGTKGGPPLAARETSRSGSALAPKLIVGGGIVALVVGAAVYETSSVDDGANGQPVGMSVAIAGGVVAGGGVYLWLRHSRATGPLSASLVGTGVAALVAGGFLYAIDEDPGPHAPYKIRDTGTAGVVIGATGAALAGVGVFLWARGTDKPAPVVSIRRGAGYVGWAGRF